MITLRPYQSEVIERVKDAFTKHKRVCLQVPTGGGKTIISAYMISNAIAKRNKVLFLVHLRELIDQTSAKLELFNVKHGFIASGYRTNDEMCQLAMIQTLNRWIDKIDFVPDFIVVDEFHHSCSKQYQKVIERFPEAKLIGLTATPIRLDGKGLKQFADVLVQGPDVKQLITDGFLNGYEYYSVPSKLDLSDVKVKMGEFEAKSLERALERADIVGDCVAHYQRYLAGKKAIVFCARVKYSHQVVAQFEAAGIRAAHLDGEMSKAERLATINKFRSGEIQVLSNCSLISEGFDVPDCDGVIMLRPTKSLGLFLQMVGRGLRPSANKTIILDHVRNHEEHGLPCDMREWALTDKKVKGGTISVSVCQDCFAVFNGRQCGACGSVRVVKIKENKSKAVVPIELVQVTIGNTNTTIEKKKGSYKQSEVNKLLRECKTNDDFYRLAKQLGYQQGWAYNRINARQKKRNGFTKDLGYRFFR